MQNTSDRGTTMVLPGGGVNEIVWSVLWEMIGNKLKYLFSNDVSVWSDHFPLIHPDDESISSNCPPLCLGDIAVRFSSELFHCCQFFSSQSASFNPMIHEMIECCYALSKTFEIIPLQLLSTAKELNPRICSSFLVSNETTSSLRFVNSSKVILFWKERIKSAMISFSLSQNSSNIVGLMYRVNEEVICDLTVEWGLPLICSSETVFQHSKLW
jgi:hypothetical protein